MANKIMDWLYDTTGVRIPFKAVDNGDDTYSTSVSLNGVDVKEGALSVHIESLHTNMINELFHEETTVVSNFAVAPIKGDITFEVDDASEFTVGDTIQIENGTVEANFPTISGISSNDITINRPLDKSYTTSASIRKITTQMNVNASPASPRFFKITPETSATAVTHITRIIFEMTHGTAGDLDKFGGISALANGVVFRIYHGAISEYETIAIWKTNADMKRTMYDVDFNARSGGQGEYGTSGRYTFEKAGAIIELDPTAGDFAELMIQDNLSGLGTYSNNAQGHTED